MSSGNVSILYDPTLVYPATPPFHPARHFPEFPSTGDLDASNAVFGAVREVLRQHELDAARYGTPEWNPLAGIVRRGDVVFLKPNMISPRHRLREEWDSVMTHGAVVRAVADYACLAMGGEGRILIGDAPQSDSRWDLLIQRMGLDALTRDLGARWPGIDVELLDLRDEHHVEKDGIYVETVRLPGDPRGGVAIDLGGESAFAPLDRDHRRYYGAYYDWSETNRHHREGRHEYRISKSPLVADVFLSIPKLKTHKKCGFTVNLKALVGINANKNWLPHYAFGAPGDGGDQFEASTFRTRLENAIVMPAKQLLIRGVPAFKEFARRTKRMGYEFFGDTEQVVRSGNWHGNDTVWRMSLDLNRILRYGNPDGSLRARGQEKRYFSLVDGIVAMEGNGPVAGERRETGLLIAGANPVAVDTVCARLMGFDPARLPILREAFRSHRWPLFEGGEADLTPISNDPRWNRPLSDWTPADSLRF